MNKRVTFMAFDVNNQLVEYEILFSYLPKGHKDEIIAFTDNSKDEEGNIKVYMAKLKRNDHEAYAELEELKDEKEIEIIEMILEEINSL